MRTIILILLSLIPIHADAAPQSFLWFFSNDIYSSNTDRSDTGRIGEDRIAPIWGYVVHRFGGPGKMPTIQSGGESVHEWQEQALLIEAGSSLEFNTDPISGPARPDSLVLISSVAPNPFNPCTVISFDLPVETEVSLMIYSGRGEQVRSLWSGVLPQGPHSSSWDGRDDAGRRASSGVYFYRLIAGCTVETKRMVLVR